MIGGQPFVLMTWNTDVQNKEALDFCKWWLSTTPRSLSRKLAVRVRYSTSH